MATATTVTQTTPVPTPAMPDLAALKTRQHAAWSSGNYAIVGTTLQIVGEELCEALDIRAGSEVLDVAAGNGMVTLAAARRWCDVTSTDYVPALLELGRARAEAEGLPVDLQGSRRREPAVRRRELRHRGFDLRRDVHAEPGQGRLRTPARVPARRPDRSRELDAGRLHRPGVQDPRQISATSGRRQVARAVGNARTAHRAVRFQGKLDQGGAPPVQFPLSVARSFPRRVRRRSTARC